MKQLRESIIQEIIRDSAYHRKDMLRDRAIDTSKLPVTPQQGELLYLLSHYDSMSLKDLTSRLEVSNSAVTQMVDTLVVKKLITRTDDKDDRRVVRVSLTPKTRKIFVTFNSRALTQAEQIFSCFTDTELITFNELHKKLLNACITLHTK